MTTVGGSRAGRSRPQARDVGGVIALAVIVAAALFAFGLLDPAGLTPGARAVADDTTVSTVEASARGRELFLSSCSACHGPDGQGTDRGPSLALSGSAAFDFYLRSGRMPLTDPDQPLEPRPPAFDEAEIEALVAYGKTIGSGPDRPHIVTDTGLLGTGREIFLNDCAACHGVSASGAGIGPDDFAPSLRDIEAQLIGEAPLVGPGPMPRFTMDDQQLSAIATYVQDATQQPSPGGLELRGFGPVAEGLIALFVGLVAILLVVRWIGSSQESTATDGPGSDDE